MPSLQDALLNAINKPVQHPAPSLRDTLNAWEQEDQPVIKPQPTKESPMVNPKPVVVFNPTSSRPRFGVSNNVSRETFNYVRDNPGKTRADVIKGLVAKGFKETSVGSLLNQLLMTGQIVRNDSGVMIVTAKEYVPINSATLKKMRATAQLNKAKDALAKAKAARDAKRAAKQAKQAPKVQAPAPVVVEPKQKYQPQEAAGIAALSPTTVSLTDLTAEKILDSLGVRQAKMLYAELKKIFEE